jgi:hypothetical protein
MENGRIKTEQYKRSSVATYAIAFASTFYFFTTLKTNAKKNKKSLQANAPNCVAICASLTRHSNGLTEARTDNSRFAKAGFSCFYDSEVLNSSLVLRNRQIL